MPDTAVSVQAERAGVTTPVFIGPADRRWWQVVLGDDAASWTVDVRGADP